MAIQNTTSFSDDGSGNSLVGQATIAVEAEQGALLGLVDAQFIERRCGGVKPGQNRPLRYKRSHRRIEGMQAIVEVLNRVLRMTLVANREGDIYEIFAYCPAGVDVLVRVLHDRNKLSGGAGKLSSSLSTLVTDFIFNTGN